MQGCSCARRCEHRPTARRGLLDWGRSGLSSWADGVSTARCGSPPRLPQGQLWIAPLSSSRERSRRSSRGQSTSRPRSS
eukprot:3123212-Pyramimonas_sp.AAC.1